VDRLFVDSKNIPLPRASVDTGLLRLANS